MKDPNAENEKRELAHKTVKSMFWILLSGKISANFADFEGGACSVGSGERQ